MNSTPGMNKSTILDTVLCIVRGEMIEECALKKRKRNTSLEEIKSMIDSYSDANTNQTYLTQLASLKQERDNIINPRLGSRGCHPQLVFLSWTPHRLR